MPRLVCKIFQLILVSHQNISTKKYQKKNDTSDFEKAVNNTNYKCDENTKKTQSEMTKKMTKKNDTSESEKAVNATNYRNDENTKQHQSDTVSCVGCVHLRFERCNKKNRKKPQKSKIEPARRFGWSCFREQQKKPQNTKQEEKNLKKMTTTPRVSTSTTICVFD